ncbi:GlxA family transcriptional regulator [Mesorhizobium sp. 131-2-5]|uniref:GlxA family transcriptional regulator n=1 Tax=Mesorhizobium sp. 131-2-5 TaxID=2744519 RepID=UPI00313D581B
MVLVCECFIASPKLEGDVRTAQDSVFAAEERPQVLVFLLLPGLSLMSLASAIEPLRSLNRLIQRPAFLWRFASPTGADIEASMGISLPTLEYNAAIPGADYLIVCAGLHTELNDERRYLQILREAGRRRINIGSLSTGTRLLARAGLLSEYRCTIHWESRSALQEEFPNLNCTNRLYEIDRDRLTCSGGTAAMDMMLHLISLQFGSDRARSVADQFHHEHIRNENEEQFGGRLEHLAHLPDNVRCAIDLMQRHVEEPIPVPHIALRAGLSVRQLERRFKMHAGLTPQRYYMQLRLQRGRELLIYSSLSVINVALSCGFDSASHFSAWYKRIFGKSPSESRRQDRTPLVNTPFEKDGASQIEALDNLRHAQVATTRVARH